MNSIEDARASLDEIAKRRNQVIDGASRGRHRGWDAAGMLAMVAGFAALDLPAPSALRLTLLAAAVAAVTCFTKAGLRSQAVLHRSQLTGRFWAVLGGVATAVGALTVGGMWLADRLDVPLRNTIIGVGLAVAIVAIEPAYRALLRRAAA